MSAFNLSGVDENLKAISAVEQSWALPALADEVKLDIAMSGSMTSSATAAFLQGLSSDISTAEQRQPSLTRDPAVHGVDRTVTDQEYSFRQQVGRTLAAQTGQRAPVVVQEDAVQRWKQQAVDEGYLDLSPTEIQSGRWLPEYSSIASQMNMDQMQREFQGEKPGSFGMGTFMNFVEEWLSPRGLYQAAMELDLLPDFDKIAEETASWGEKLRDWASEPWNPGKLIDALGPVDNILFPVLNWGLMMTGVGEVWGFSKVVGSAAVKAGMAGKVANVEGLYRGTRGLGMVRAADHTADAIRMKKSSMFSQVMDYRDPTQVGSALGAGVNAIRGTLPVRGLSTAGKNWRQLSSVAVAKKANQQVLRMGVASNLQGLVDDERSGTSVASLTTVDEWHERQMANPLADFAFDALFTPINIFEPGSIIAAAQGVKKAAVAATPGITQIAENQELVLAADKGIRAALMDEGGEALVKKYADDVKEHGVNQAIANQYTNGDTERVGELIGFVTVMNVVDSYSSAMARTQGVAEMSTKELGDFHHIRNQTAAKLVKIEDGDLEEAIRLMSRYGDPDTLVGAQTASRNQAKLQRRINRIRDGYLEDIRDVEARGGAVAEGNHRFYGIQDPDDPQIVRWTTNMDEAGDNPLFFDVAAEELAGHRGVAIGAELDDLVGTDLDVFATRYHGYRLNDAPNVRGYTPDGIKALRGMIENHNNGRRAFMRDLMDQHLNPEQFGVYMNEIAPTFGKWDAFTESVDAIKVARRQGLLDGLEAVPAYSPAGRQVSMHPRMNPKWSAEMQHLMIQIPRDQELAAHLGKSYFTPFAREMDPTLGGVTVAAKGTRTKQEAIAAAAHLKSKNNRLKQWRKIMANPRAKDAIEEIETALEGTLGDGAREIIQDIASKHGISSIKSQRALKALWDIAQDSDVSIAKVNRVIEKELDELTMLADWSEHFGIPSHLYQTGDPMERAAKLQRELQAKSKFMATELDPESIPRELREMLAGHDYKLVHGVEFFQPHQMLDLVPEIGQATQKHIRSKKLGSFFGRVDPGEMRAAKMKMLRSSVVAEMNKSKALGRKIHVNVGTNPLERGIGDLDQIQRDIFDVLDQIGEESQQALAQVKDARATTRIATNVRLGQTPMTPEDLPTNLKLEEFIRRFKEIGYTTDESKALYRALKQSRKIGFEYHGLYNIETHLRSNPNLLNGLSLLGRHKAADGLSNKVVAKGLGWGAPLGMGIAAAKDYDESHPDNVGSLGGSLGRLGAFAVGSAAGRAGGNLAARKLGVAALEEGSRAARLLAKRENSSSWMRYAYLSDEVARFRDWARFTLSPIFDASRYSEAIILSQLEEVPAGLRNLKLNQSPTSYRKQVARNARKMKGMDPDQARQLANDEWLRRKDEFAAAARHDFDWETIDGVGRRFSSVGILGFSPTDWMSSTFAHLRDAGLDSRKAYETVREMYTYGTTHRSAAEMSMNFVFFPFSFTKKVAGHMTRSVNSDMSRLIMIHDGLAAYQMLDEEHDLGQMWKDRLPILEKAYRLNVLAYGATLGRFGGVNAQLLETVRNMPLVGNAAYVGPEMDSIMNLFIPQAVPVNNQGQANDLWDTAVGLVPLYNDARTMISATIEQSNVLTSESHMTSEAEQRHGWETWRAFQDEVLQTLKTSGMTWDQAVRDPAIGAWINQQKTEISVKYPAWKYALGDGMAHNNAITMEIDERTQHPKALEDYQLQGFETAVEQMDTALRNVGMTSSNLEEVPPEWFDVMRKIAQDYVNENPAFLRLYNRFYRRKFGPITVEMT